MKINPVQTYMQASAIRPTQVRQAISSIKGVAIPTAQTAVSARQNITPQSVVSSEEKQFFSRLFPEISAQLRKDVTFNQQGQTQPQTGLFKGRIFDGRA